MNTRIRFLLALALFAAIVIAAIGAPAWADRLNIGAQAPSAGGLQANMPVGSRPQGTVVTTGPVIPVTGGQAVTVASCATVQVKTPPDGVEYTASVVSAESLPVVLPGNLISCAIKVEAKPGASLGAEVLVCFPVPPTGAGFAYQHDGEQWVKTTLEVKDGQACVTVPATAANPGFAAFFGE
ncbi:MAG: hypothetical protein V1755_03225 [Chloroflexota bacterium]